MKTVKTLFFASAKQSVGLTESVISLEKDNYLGRELLDLIIQQFRELEELRPSLTLAVNEEYISLDDTLHAETIFEVAVIPPLSGG
ncbi:hypothetical protein QYM36_015071 [Artemia franciscana]|nr:hypothetical protein QYM36_015071 [Artemia franciscana]